MLANWLSTNGLDHGYKANSLRTMVWRALEAIEILETFTSWTIHEPAWAPLTLEQ